MLMFTMKVHIVYYLHCSLSKDRWSTNYQGSQYLCRRFWWLCVGWCVWILLWDVHRCLWDFIGSQCWGWKNLFTRVNILPGNLWIITIFFLIAQRKKLMDIFGYFSLRMLGSSHGSKNQFLTFKRVITFCRVGPEMNLWVSNNSYCRCSG